MEASKAVQDTIASPGLDYFIGRQAILEADGNTFGYELLFRSSSLNQADIVDGNSATQKVLNCVMNVMGIDSLVGNSKAFVNVTQEILFESTYTMLPSDKVIIELLEDIEPTPEVIKACKKHKSRNYTLALDDFFDRDGYGELLSLADIVKVDFMAVPDKKGRAALTRKLKVFDLELLAEKVETEEDAKQARSMGYKYFQGYFYQKPTIIKGQSITPSKQSCLRLLQVINDENAAIQNIEAVIKSDPSLTTRLLRYINSAFFGLRTKVSSIAHGLKLLGMLNLQKWGALVAVEQLNDSFPVELTRDCISRAMFCEQLAGHLPVDIRAFDLFMAGMLSLMDTLTGMPKDKVLEQIAVNKEIAAAIMGEASPLADVLRLADACEKFKRADMKLYADRLQIDLEFVLERYQKAVQDALQLI